MFFVYLCLSRHGISLLVYKIATNVIEFALKSNEELLYLNLKLTTTGATVFDKSTVIFISKMWMKLCWRIDSKCNTLLKLKGLILQVSDLSNDALELLSKIGESESRRKLLNSRTDLVIFDENNTRGLKCPTPSQVQNITTKFQIIRWTKFRHF